VFISIAPKQYFKDGYPYITTKFEVHYSEMKSQEKNKKREGESLVTHRPHH
jgi:hypothetical protein